MAPPAGAVPSRGSVHGRRPKTTVILPILREIPLAELARGTGLSERTIRAIRNGKARAAREALARLAADHAFLHSGWST